MRVLLLAIVLVALAEGQSNRHNGGTEKMEVGHRLTSFMKEVDTKDMPHKYNPLVKSKESVHKLLGKFGLKRHLSTHSKKKISKPSTFLSSLVKNKKQGLSKLSKNPSPLPPHPSPGSAAKSVVMPLLISKKDPTVCEDRAPNNICDHMKQLGYCHSRYFAIASDAFRNCRKTCELCQACAPGYEKNKKGQCKDIDECARKDACAENAICTNTRGSHQCQCKKWYKGDGKKKCNKHVADQSTRCLHFRREYDWCRSRKTFMSALCPVTCGVHERVCSAGYEAHPTDRKRCRDVDECATRTHRCGTNSSCSNAPAGSYTCRCLAGFKFDSRTRTCQPHCVDESKERCRERRDAAMCSNALVQAAVLRRCPRSCDACGRPICDRGFLLTAEGACRDVDECSDPLLNGCAANSKCINTKGGYRCTCRPGYFGNGYVKCYESKCHDWGNKCSELKHKNLCNAKPLRGYASRYCAKTCGLCSEGRRGRCRKGYTKKPDGHCWDVDECKTGHNTCPSNSVCSNTWGSYKCVCRTGFNPVKKGSNWSCLRENYCYATGDPHYRTFDGKMINFQGDCRYLLAKPCRDASLNKDFSVFVDNEVRDGMTDGTWVRAVIVKLPGTTIRIGKNKKVYVDGQIVNLPHSPKDGVKIHHSGGMALLEADSGLRVAFDGEHYAKVAVPDKYKNKMCGMCGNLDGKRNNDLRTKEGKKTKSHAAVGNSYAVGDKCRPASDTKPKCGKIERSAFESKCKILINKKGPFSKCHALLNAREAYENCVSDLCMNSKNPKTLCDAVHAYAAECEELGQDVGTGRNLVDQWRKPNFCPLSCGRNMHYSLCMSACPDSCVAPKASASCSDNCVEGCQCDAGFVISGSQCVRKSDCGCMHAGKYFAVAESWYSETCTTKYMCAAPEKIEALPISCDDTRAAECLPKAGKLACYCKGSKDICEKIIGKAVPEPNDATYDPEELLEDEDEDDDDDEAVTENKFPYSKDDAEKPDEEAEDMDDEYFDLGPKPAPKPKPGPLGMENGIIPDSSINPSSLAPGAAVGNLRPYSLTGWLPNANDATPSVTIDLGQKTAVHGFGTLGSPSQACWVQTYVVETSDDGQNYRTLELKDSKQARLFVGNHDQNTWKRHCAHRYYGSPVSARYIRFLPKSHHGCVSLRLEVYGFRSGSDRHLMQALIHDHWTKAVSGCMCYFDNSRFDCACCHDGGCQCSHRNPHQCVQCGYAESCGKPNFNFGGIIRQADAWTKSQTGCPCHWNPSDLTGCACCQQHSCQCGPEQPNQCVQCGHPDACGEKPAVYGVMKYCSPKLCPPGVKPLPVNLIRYSKDSLFNNPKDVSPVLHR